VKGVCPVCGYEGSLDEAPVGRKVVCPTCGRLHSPLAIQVAKAPKSRRRTTRGRSTRQEKYNAKRVGGDITLNSGAMDDKGDIKVPGVLRDENKTTQYRSFSLKLSDLIKVASAAKGDEIPVMTICFEDDLNQQYRVIRDADFMELFNFYRKHRGNHLD
jgi:uncharacterized Zn finger protein (UPF0148 family)